MTFPCGCARVTPSPLWGEGGGEGPRGTVAALGPSPQPSPRGRGRNTEEQLKTWPPSNAAHTQKCSVPQSATEFASPTRPSSSKSRRITPRSGRLRRGSEVRGRQDDSRWHGPEPAARCRGGRYGDHECVDHRSLGHREGRCGDQERLDQRDRQGRQPRCSAGSRHRDRPRHRDHRRRREHPHHGWHRHPTSTSSARSRSKRR